MSRTDKHVPARLVADLPWWNARKYYAKVCRHSEQNCDYCYARYRKTRTTRKREWLNYEEKAGN